MLERRRGPRDDAQPAEVVREASFVERLDLFDRAAGIEPTDVVRDALTPAVAERLPGDGRLPELAREVVLDVEPHLERVDQHSVQVEQQTPHVPHATTLANRRDRVNGEVSGRPGLTARCSAPRVPAWSPRRPKRASCSTRSPRSWWPSASPRPASCCGAGGGEIAARSCSSCSRSWWRWRSRASRGSGIRSATAPRSMTSPSGRPAI